MPSEKYENAMGHVAVSFFGVMLWWRLVQMMGGRYTPEEADAARQLAKIAPAVPAWTPPGVPEPGVPEEYYVPYEPPGTLAELEELGPEGLPPRVTAPPALVPEGQEIVGKEQVYVEEHRRLEEREFGVSEYAQEAARERKRQSERRDRAQEAITREVRRQQALPAAERERIVREVSEPMERARATEEREYGRSGYAEREAGKRREAVARAERMRKLTTYEVSRSRAGAWGPEGERVR